MSSPSFARCGLVVKRDAPGATSTLSALRDCLRLLDVPAVTDTDTANALAPDMEACPLERMADHCDLMVVVGGDGTLLRACRAVIAKNLPILGVNLGRLGFMVDIAPESIAQVLPEILAGRYVEEQRFVLQAATPDDGLPGLAVNDVVLRHPDPVSMLEFATYANDRLISHHRSDGLIISTPTGSTAYALSAGGPMMHPRSSAVAMVPICPHTLSDRPLILPAETQIRVEVAGRDGRGAIVTLDGHKNTALNNGDSLWVSRADTPLRLIHPADYDWYGILRSKLNWGRDKPTLRSQ